MQLEELGRLDWVTQACEELRARPVSGQRPEDAWTRLKDVRGLAAATACGGTGDRGVA